MSWIDIIGVAGLLATLIGVYLGWGPWREHRKQSKQDDLAVLTEFARTILKDCKEGSAARFPYAEVKGAIKLTCLLNNETRPRDLVHELAKQPPSGEAPKPTLVVGEYGQGKTIACGALAQELASSFLRAPRNGRLPVLIPLREYPDLSSLDEVALTSIRRLHNFDVEPEIYKRARAAGRFIFILDGLDELLSKDPSTAVRDHLDTLLNDAAFRKNPLIVTTRPNVFSQLDVSYFKSEFNWITIQLPTLNQVYGYLSSKGLLAFLAMIQHADAELFQGLIRRPLFLDMITASAASLPKIHTAQDITESKIYDQYFNAWYLRELPKMGPTLKTLTLDQVDRILSLAANEMTTQNRLYITESEFVAIVQKEAQTDPRHDLDTLERQATNRLLLVPEFSVGGRRFTFRHDSLRSYFCARYFYRHFIDTGWKVGGRLQWLHVAVSAQVTVYAILPGRGYEQSVAILGAAYDGFLVHDGWAPYYRFQFALHQSCLAHLLKRCREMAQIASPAALAFPRAVERLLQAGLGLRDRQARGEISEHGIRTATGKLEAKLDRMLQTRRRNPANRRLARHLEHERLWLFTFLHCFGLDATNNAAERAIRGMVIARKVWGGNRTWEGAHTQQILVSVLRTCWQQGKDAFTRCVKLLRAPRTVILDIVPGPG